MKIYIETILLLYNIIIIKKNYIFSNENLYKIETILKKII